MHFIIVPDITVYCYLIRSNFPFNSSLVPSPALPPSLQLGPLSLLLKTKLKSYSLLDKRQCMLPPFLPPFLSPFFLPPFPHVKKKRKSSSWVCAFPLPPFLPSSLYFLPALLPSLASSLSPYSISFIPLTYPFPPPSLPPFLPPSLSPDGLCNEQLRQPGADAGM